VKNAARKFKLWVPGTLRSLRDNKSLAILRVTSLKSTKMDLKSLNRDHRKIVETLGILM